MSLLSRLLVSVALVLLWNFIVLGQTARTIPAAPAVNGGVPPVGDPTVFLMFLRYEDSLVQTVQTERAADPVTGTTKLEAAAKLLGVSVDDFKKISPVYRVLAAALQTIDSEANAYRDAVVAGRQKLDTSIIQQFSSRRDEAIGNGKTQLQNALTRAGWTSLSQFIEGTFRQSIVRRPIGQ